MLLNLNELFQFELLVYYAEYIVVTKATHLTLHIIVTFISI